jgi:glutamyl-tRNA reductase
MGLGEKTVGVLSKIVPKEIMAGAAIGLLEKGYSKLKDALKDKSTTPTVPTLPASTQTVLSQSPEKTIAETQAEQKKVLAQKAAKRTQTILTSPLGVTQQANTQVRTLLGTSR